MPQICGFESYQNPKLFLIRSQNVPSIGPIWSRSHHSGSKIDRVICIWNVKIWFCSPCTYYLPSTTLLRKDVSPTIDLVCMNWTSKIQFERVSISLQTVLSSLVTKRNCKMKRFSITSLANCLASKSIKNFDASIWGFRITVERKPILQNAFFEIPGNQRYHFRQWQSQNFTSNHSNVVYVWQWQTFDKYWQSIVCL